MQLAENKHNSLLLEAKNISFRYSKKSEPVFSGLSLSVLDGESILLMGPSGCGKSSLSYCLAGLYPTYAGQLDGDIFIAGEPINDMSPCDRSQLVSILFQNPDNQFCMERVNQEILFALENINYAGDLNTRMEELLDLVELKSVKDAPIYTLSGGTKQKIAIATALATGAKMLILDEPLANLDPASSVMVVSVLKKLHKSGLTLLIVDHKPQLWRKFVDKVLLMDHKGNLSDKSLDPERLEEYSNEFDTRGIFLNDDWLVKYHPIQVPKPSNSIVKLERVQISYNKKVILSDVSLELERGSVTVLVGGNGNGKTTLLSAMAGVIPHRGHMKIDGQVGLVFQNPRFQFLTLSVEEEVLETLAVIRPNDTNELLIEEVEKLLDEFGLLELRKASPYALSQGQQRRLALLSMLVGEQSLLLIDEPTYAQDENATRFILDLLKRKVEEGLTAVISTHDLVMAKAIANRIFLVEGGKVTELLLKEFEKYIKERGTVI